MQIFNNKDIVLSICSYLNLNDLLILRQISKNFLPENLYGYRFKQFDKLLNHEQRNLDHILRGYMKFMGRVDLDVSLGSEDGLEILRTHKHNNRTIDIDLFTRICFDGYFKSGKYDMEHSFQFYNFEKEVDKDICQMLLNIGFVLDESEGCYEYVTKKSVDLTNMLSKLFEHVFPLLDKSQWINSDLLEELFL